MRLLFSVIPICLIGLTISYSIKLRDISGSLDIPEVLEPTIYRLNNENAELHCEKIDEKIFHIRSPEKAFLPGMFGHSYSFSKTGSTSLQDSDILTSRN